VVYVLEWSAAGLAVWTNDIVDSYQNGSFFNLGPAQTAYSIGGASGILDGSAPVRVGD
jgi:hypothetical protein